MLSAPKLKVISRYGVGIDRVDIKAASKRNHCDKHAEFQFTGSCGISDCFYVCTCRNLVKLNNTTKEGQWVRSNGIELAEKLWNSRHRCYRQQSCQNGKGLGMEVVAVDPYGDAAFCKNGIELLKTMMNYMKFQILSVYIYRY